MAIIDARDLPEATEIEADLVIVGGGMAGIAIATEWAGANKTVAILESGGLEFDQTIQDLYRGSGVMRAPDNAEASLDDYTWQSRMRILGGSAAIWGGKCVPLDEADFARRDWLSRTGWPMTRAQLQPYYDRACRLLEVPLFDRDFDSAQEEGRPPLTVNNARDFFSAPRYFSPIGGGDQEKFDRFRIAPSEAENVTVYLHANVTEIRQRRRGRRISDLAVACLNGKRHTARGRAYVLATGGIENVRLLLASDLGNDSDQLGRNFMGHVTFGQFEDEQPISMLAISDAQRPMTLYTDNGRDKVHCVLAATLDAQRRFSMGNFTATMVNATFPPNPNVEATRTLAALLDQNGLAVEPAQRVATYFMAEHMPNPESRITLDAANVDALGVPKVRLDWVYTGRDLDNLEAGVNALAQVLGESNTGRVCWPVPRNEWLAGFSPSRHHMGATRMSVNRDDGVVNANCRVHGLDNLYIASVSVFPTSGIANPSLTLVALAMRLSDHLKRDLGVRS